ncbi:MAG: hypothetical protein IKR27_00820 [Lachnospiraceae bacterium]|nr:hypothetical protein [Lachnospiraceae bacterium]
MKTIKFIDMTLRALAEKNNGLSFKEKLEIARILDRVKADIIELPPVTASKADQLSNKTISTMLNTTVSASVNICSGMIEETWESIRTGRKARLNLITPVSTVQMEYSCHKKAPKMLEAITEQVKLCRSLCENVEFTAVDATRAEFDFLVQAIEAAVAAGASRITVCDTAGVMLPDEFGAFIEKIKESAPSLNNEEINLYVEVKSDMGIALATAAAAVKAGADGVKCVAFGNEYPTLEQASLLVQKKGSALNVSAPINTTEITRCTGQIEKLIIKPEEKATSFKDIAIANGIEVTLDANDDITEVTKVVNQLGYDLSDEDNAKVYEAFLRVANKKHYVGTKELDAIIASTAMQVPSKFRLDSYVINSGNIITATANILLEKNGEKIRGVGVGDGPVDAAFLAIEQILGHHYELDDFQVQTVTEGRDAMGSALVKLRANGKVYSGSGISTDIIGASIRAYISALNKIVFEEER